MRPTFRIISGERWDIGPPNYRRDEGWGEERRLLWVPVPKASKESLIGGKGPREHWMPVWKGHTPRYPVSWDEVGLMEKEAGAMGKALD